VERRFAGALESDSSVKLFLKLPSWFKVSTPLGNYNPDWAILKEEAGQLFLYMIRETKGNDNPEDLFREAERWKVSFGSKHFESIAVDYEVTSNWVSAKQNIAQVFDWLRIMSTTSGTLSQAARDLGENWPIESAVPSLAPNLLFRNAPLELLASNLY
jgi:restriction endonuclease